MGAASLHPPALLILAAFSRHAELLAWGKGQAEGAWGPVALESDVFAFEETRYYQKTMGEGLLKQFFAFDALIDPARLPAVKQQTNAWEADCQADGRWPEPRPLNLDPGYLTQAKLVLATTKDRDHRIYLGEGIFAEVTLAYSGGAWQSRPWTYPDYCRVEYHQFFVRCRDAYRRRLHRL